MCGSKNESRDRANERGNRNQTDRVREESSRSSADVGEREGEKAAGGESERGLSPATQLIRKSDERQRKGGEGRRKQR